MKKKSLFILLTAIGISYTIAAKDTDSGLNALVSDEIVDQQRKNLATNTEGKGFSPQAPRDIDLVSGNNIAFNAAPPSSQMNLCNIHLHKNAEHKGGEFTKYAGNGDGHGYHTGYQYSGSLTQQELASVEEEICLGKHGGLAPGDTIEVHYVHLSAQIKPGPTLGSCLNDSVKNPQLRVETQVYVLVNDQNARDFGKLTQHGIKNGLQQALNIPNDTGIPVQYASSATGPSYNEQGSPFQVT